MAKFKCLKSASESGNTVLKGTVSSSVTVGGSHPGGVGGPHGKGFPTINVSFRVNGVTYSGWILHKKAKRTFIVTDGTHTARCTLVNLNAAGLNVDNTMTILVTKSDASTFNAASIGNKRVTDWSGVKSLYHLAAATTTYVQVAFA